MQFTFTKKYFLVNFVIYTIGFIIPFVYYITDYYQHQHIQAERTTTSGERMILAMSIITQLLFFAFECLQFRIFGFRQYFSEVWNFFEITQFLLYFEYISVKLSTDFEKDSVPEILILIFLSI